MADEASSAIEDMSPEVKELQEKAEKGDEESQLKLGQHFRKLADASDEKKQQELGVVAVRWLVAASKQGNDEATEELQKCVDTETGITDENKEEVQWCVQTTNLEKKIRFAARNMFMKINTTHKEVLSPEEYTEAIKKVTGGTEQKLLLAAGRKLGQNISENEFVQVLSRKVQGQLTFTSAERSAAYETASPLQKIVKFPRETAMALGDQALEFASRDGLGMVMGCIPIDQIYFLMLFFVYGFLTPKFLFEIVPLIVFYLSYAVIIVTTLQMFYKKKKSKEAHVLAECLKQYDVGVDVTKTQSQYSWNSLTPYLVYFGFIPLVVASFSLADKMYIPCSELCILNGVMCGLCFVAISDSHDLVTLLALFCSFLAGLPVFLQGFPDFPVITSLVKIISGSLFTVEIFSGFKLNIGIPSVCYCIIPLFFVQMAARSSFQGMYKVAIPHLVCYFWFNLITTMYPFSTWLGLARATVGYVMLPLLIPLSVFIFIFGVIYAFVKLMSSDMFGKIFITALLACIPILLTQTKKLFGGKLDKDNRFRMLKKVLMYGFAILAVIPLIFVRLPQGQEVAYVSLTPEEFYRVCDSNLENSMNCHTLKGTKVKWQGTIEKKSVTGVSNDIAKMLDVFPGFIGRPLRCIYGKKYKCDEEDLTEHERDYCKLMVSFGDECGVEDHDKFTFSFAVKLDNGQSINLEAGSGFKATFMELADGDRIEFKAGISDAMARPLKLHLKKIHCLNRKIDIEDAEEEEEDVYYNLFEQALGVAFNFFWYPLVEYVPHLYVQGEVISDQTVVQAT